ncbi:hypothetical protein BVX98_06210 [bacterium F11]|nr:hypothetical protein BVX98_06210 [bacterium F11]
MLTLIEQLLKNSIGLLFLIISLGVLIGNIPLGRFKLGGAGVLLVGLVFGHFGFVLPKDLQTIGVVIFVYAVGLRAGPHLFQSFNQVRKHVFLLSLLIVATGGAIALIFRSFLKIDAELVTGIYSGALTSTPALAAAMEMAGNSTPSVGYGLAYPFGILGVILMVQILPPLLGINLKEEEKKYQRNLGRMAIEKRSFRVTNINATTLAIDQILDRGENRFQFARVQRGDHVMALRPDQYLQLNDVVLGVGTNEGLNELELIIGEPVEEPVPESQDAQSRWVLISSRKFVGKSIGNLEIFHLFGLIITRIRRSDVEFVPHSNFSLEAGDEIRVSGRPEDLQYFSALVGRHPESVYETDIFSFALGLALGVLVGLVKIPITKDLSLQFGIAGGPLLIGILFGHLGRFGRVTGYMPKAAQFVVGELGLYLFLAVAGTLAGPHFLPVFKEQGFILILTGILITIGPMVVAFFVARTMLKLNVLTILGMICGGMTSTPALGVLTSHTKSDVPALGYTSIYPVAVLLTTLMAQILISI